MKIEKHRYVVIEYFVTNEYGDVVDQSDPGTPMGFVFGTGQMPEGVEKTLDGRIAGDHLRFKLEPKDAYGVREETLVRPMNRNSFPPEMDLRQGEQYQARSSIGPVSFRVESIDEKKVVGDFNHPLAGEALEFDIQVLQVREASAIEIAMAISETSRSF